MKKIFLACFTLLTISAVLGAYVLFKNGFGFQTDLLSLLPKSSQSAVTLAASKRLTENFGDSFIFMFASPNRDEAIKANQYAMQLIRDNPFAQLADNQQVVTQRLDYFQQLKKYRFHLLSESQQQLLSSDETQTLLQQAWQALYSPTNLANIANLTEDPLNLFNSYINNSHSSPINIEATASGLLVSSEAEPTIVFGLINGRVVPGAYSLEAQDQIMAMVQQLEQRISTKHVDTQLYKAGAVFHGATAAAAAKKEISLIAGGSCIGILFIFLISFRSLRPLFFSLTSIAYGSLCALIFCQLIFKEIHLLTLVFGASLIGVAIDYALHYLTRATSINLSNSEQRQQLLRHMLPSLSMGLVTSLIGYSSLFQAPLPGLQQMALFSIVGLISAWLFVVSIFPLLSFSHNNKKSLALTKLAALPQYLWQKISVKSTAYSLTLITITALLVINFQAVTTNDIRLLHTPNPELLAEQTRIDTLLPSHASNQFFLITQSTEQEVLLSAKQFKATLQQLVTQGAISRYHLISDVLPASDTQQANKHLLEQSLYRAGGDADQFMTTAGFDKTAIENFHRSLNNTNKTLLPDEWLAIAPAEQQLLWLGELENQFTSIVLLQGVSDLSQLQQAAVNHPSIRFVDTVAGISNTLDSKRQSASQMLVLAYIAILILLLLRYRQAQAIGLLCIPLLSSLLTLALLSSVGVAISLFHIFALFLVLGLGMDYSIFLYESYRHDSSNPLSGDDTQHCQLAIVLSVITSGLSFGLLALSSTAMISAFGITVLLGSLLNWLLVPLIRYCVTQPQ